MKVIAAILIIAGLIIGAYPIADELYTRYLEYKMMDAYIESLTQEVVSPDISDGFEQLQLVFEEERENYGNIQSDEGTAADLQHESPDSDEASAGQSSSELHIIGRIEIPKIEVNIPILEGANKANLKVGAGHITGTAKLGSIGNAALAAHRGHTYGRLFNRLDELEVGDTINITTGEGSYEYTVYKILVVSPDDISVLYQSKEERILTLITCTPLYIATHRLIVHAVMR